MGTTPNFAFPWPAGTDPVAQGDDAIKALADALDALLGGGAGWQNIAVLPGFAAQAGLPPQCIKFGNLVFMRGGFANTGMSASGNFSVGTIPVGYRPASGQNVYIPVGANNAGSTGEAVCWGNDGHIEIRTGASLGSYYILNAISYPII